MERRREELGVANNVANTPAVCIAGFTDSNGSVTSGTCVANTISNTAAVCDGGYTATNGTASAGTCTANNITTGYGNAFDSGYDDNNGKTTGGTCITEAAAFFPNSAILTFAEKWTINENWVGTSVIEWVLCYRKSLHGASSSTFHTNCDGRGASVTIASLNAGYRVGGYNPSS